MEELQRLAERMSRRIRFDIMAKGAFVIDTSDPAAMEKLMEDPNDRLMREYRQSLSSAHQHKPDPVATNRRQRRRAEALERKKK